MSLKSLRFLLAAIALAAGIVDAQLVRPLMGRTVQSVIEELRSAGTPLVYSNSLLPDSLTVSAEPTATEPLDLAREILAEHGLALRAEGGAWLVVRADAQASGPGGLVIDARAAFAGAPLASFSVQVEGPAASSAQGVDGRAELSALEPGRYSVVVRSPGFMPQRSVATVTAGTTASLSVMLMEAVAKLEEVVVTASRYDLENRAQPSTADFSREDIENFLTLGDDALRVAQRLPGVANNGFSARPYMRGGAPNEVAVHLDGVRLIEPYHLRDFQSVFSAIDERIVDHVAVHAGGMPAEYGDALSGLMVVEPREPRAIENELGLSVLYTSVLTSGVFAEDRASWLFSARDSNLDQVVTDHIGQPSYSDVFLRMSVDLGSKHRLVFADLSFNDDIQLTLEDDAVDREQAASDTDAHQAWLKLESQWTEKLSSSTWAYATSLRSERREDVADLAELVGTVDDRRKIESVAVKQSWQRVASERQLMRFGFEVEQREAEYRYSSAAHRRGLLGTLVDDPFLARDSALAPQGDSYAVYFEDRLRLGARVVADLGVRWDRQNYLPSEDADDRYSPRLSLLVQLTARDDLRLSYGRFFQAEGLLDLQVEDGVTDFSPAQRSAHTIVSLEHRFPETITIRTELYYKAASDVRPRFENLFEPLVVAPELRASRVLVTPDRARANGLELFVSGERPTSWWAGVSLANADDIIAGASVPRSWDQDRALSAGVTWETGPWRISAAASAHRGWPATEVSVVDDATGEPVAVTGPRNAVRLRNVRKLDFGASRDFALGSTALEFFAEVSNLTNRENPCCLVYEDAIAPDGSPTLVRDERGQAGITGNIGLLWQF
jgi:outer membrane receptor protein involved in Fe transport